MRNILGSLLVIFFLAASVHAADKIRIAFPDLAAQFVPLPLGEKKDFFREEGLQVEFIRVRPAVAMAALVSGEIDYYTVIGPGVTAAIQGMPLKVVACYAPGAPIALITRPEFKSVRELKGQSIGINGFGAATHITARLIFKHFGLDPDKEIKFLDTGPLEARFAAMSRGLSAGTVGSPPTDFLGKKLGFVVLARAHELFSYPVSGLVATVRKVKERPYEIKQVIKAGIKANRYMYHDREGTIQVMMHWLKIDKEMATATYEGVLKAFNEDGSIPEKGLRLVIEEAKKTANVDRDVSLSDVADFTILGEAQKELGIKGR